MGPQILINGFKKPQGNFTKLHKYEFFVFCLFVFCFNKGVRWGKQQRFGQVDRHGNRKAVARSGKPPRVVTS